MIFRQQIKVSDLHLIDQNTLNNKIFNVVHLSFGWGGEAYSPIKKPKSLSFYAYKRVIGWEKFVELC